jgi:hypothetical protein
LQKSGYDVPMMPCIPLPRGHLERVAQLAEHAIGNCSVRDPILLPGLCVR